MIVDELRAASKPFRTLTAGAHVVRVPWQVCPLTTVPDGVLGLNWTAPSDEKLIPKNAEGTAIDSSWWRPPFDSMLIVSEQQERGVLFVWTRNGAAWDEYLDSMKGVPHKPDWGALVAMIALHPDGKVRVLAATQFYSSGGELWDWEPVRAKATRFMDEVIAGVPIGSLAHTDKSIRDLWHASPSDYRMDFQNMGIAFSIACALMCCKNISTEEVRHDQRLQLARIRRGKLPLVSFHVLRIRLPKVRRTRDGVQRVPSDGTTSEALALHWVRGHFKRYSEDRPLLGKVSGTFWWTPHLAGRADRVMLKEYELGGAQ